MLVLTRAREEAIVINGRIEVRVLDIRGDRVRLGILAPHDVPVHRKEVFLAIQKENLEASQAPAASLDDALRLLGEAPKAGEKGEPGADKRAD